MPRYIWQDDASNVAEVDIRDSLKHLHAIVRFKDGHIPENLNELPGLFQKRGFIATPDVDDGKPTLRLHQFKKASDVFSALAEEGLTQGSFSKKEALTEELDPTIRTTRQYIKEHSIQLAGAVYLIADAMPIASGIVRKTPAEVAQGAMWATTSAALLLFGRKNPEIQMGNMYANMRDFMAQEGVELGKDQALSVEQLQANPGYWNSMINFLYDHPVLFNNSLQGYGGVKQMHAGRAQDNNFKAAAGVAVAAGQWSGMLIPEDKYAGLPAEQRAHKLQQKALGKEDEDGFHTRFTDNPVAWVQEKPLRLTAIGPIIGNFLTAASALFHDRHEVNKFFQQYDSSKFASSKFELNPNTLMRDASRSTKGLLKAAGVSKETLKADRLKPEWEQQYERLNCMVNTQIGWKFTMLTPVFNIIANTLYGMSSKEERSVNLDKEGYLNELIGVAANIYSHVPESQRGEKLIRFAGFLKSQPDVNISEKEIRTRLSQKIEALEQSGWAGKIANEDRTPEAQQTASL